MAVLERGIDRRTLIKLGIAATVGIGTAATVGSELHSFYLEHERLSRLPSKVMLPQGAVFFGHAPDKNDVKHTVEMTKEYKFPLQVSHILFTFEYDDLNSVFDTISGLIHQGITPLVSAGPRGALDGERRTLQYYLNSPDFYNYLWKLAGRFKKIDKPFYFSPYPEFNGDWYDAYGTRYNTSEQFKTLWKTTFMIFQNAHADNVRFVFTPNTTAYSSDIEPFFPGKEYMHAVSLHGYNFSTSDRRQVERRLKPNISPLAMFGPDVGELRRLAPGLPIFISEYNTAQENNAESLKWLMNIFQLREYGVCGFIPYTVNKFDQSAIETDWSENFRRPAVIAAHQELLKHESFQQFRSDGLFADNPLLRAA